MLYNNLGVLAEPSHCLSHCWLFNYVQYYCGDANWGTSPLLDNILNYERWFYLKSSFLPCVPVTDSNR
jgi:hypothetical protein